VDHTDELFEGLKVVNTVYKSQNVIHACNTDTLGAIYSIESAIKSTTIKNILILGCGGAGYPVAVKLSEYYSCNVFVYDIRTINAIFNTKVIKVIKSLNEIFPQKFEVIINATPLGKFYKNTLISGLNSPLDYSMIKQLSHPDTILMEMNYLPEYTFFLQCGLALGLRVIPGVNMLVHQAIASLAKYYPEREINIDTNLIIAKMLKFIKLNEEKIFNLKVNDYK